MAESLDDGEFWLPPQFLTDDDLFFDKKRTNSTPVFAPLKSKPAEFFAPEATRFAEDLFPLEFPYGFDVYGGGVSSDLSSPVDSLVGSTEHSDEEDLLTCRMTGRSKVEGDLRGYDVAFGGEHTKGRTVSGSPQSTLCGIGNCCRCRKPSSHGSPNQCSKVSSPPATWDLLHAAAGEVAGMGIDDEGCILNNYSRGILGPPKKPSAIPDISFLQQQSIAYQKLQAAHFHQMRQQQMMKQQSTEAWGVQSKSAAAVYSQQLQAQPAVQSRGRIIGSGRPMSLSPSVWPPVQQAHHRQDGSSMRAAFLANLGAKRECAGTGVFLPRQIATPAVTESRKKTACATVLLPAKVVQALKLDDVGQNQKPQFHRLNGTFHPGGENAAKPRNCHVQKRNVRPQPEFNSGEVRLPQEWTY